MKTLIFVLSTGKTGTVRLWEALRSIGMDAYHEIVQINSIYLPWMEKRFTQNPALDVETAKKMWQGELLKYLDGDGYFADISHYLATLYPIIDAMDIETRSVHLTRSFWPHRVRVYNLFADTDRTFMKITDNSEYVYPAELTWISDLKWEEWAAMSQFERLCWYWVAINEYFLKGNRKVFHVEDFNKQALDILEILYPEATEDQKEKFTKTLFYNPRTPENTVPPYTIKMNEEEQEIYERVCGLMLKKLGY